LKRIKNVGVKDFLKSFKKSCAADFNAVLYVVVEGAIQADSMKNLTLNPDF